MSWFRRMSPEAERKIFELLESLHKKADRLEEIVMGAFQTVQNAEALLHTDLATENGLITQLLTAFANGTISPAQAQALVTQIQSDDTTAQQNATAIQAALGITPAAGTGSASTAAPAGGSVPSTPGSTGSASPSAPAAGASSGGGTPASS